MFCQVGVGITAAVLILIQEDSLSFPPSWAAVAHSAVNKWSWKAALLLKKNTKGLEETKSACPEHCFVLTICSPIALRCCGWTFSSAILHTAVPLPGLTDLAFHVQSQVWHQTKCIIQLPDFTADLAACQGTKVIQHTLPRDPLLIHSVPFTFSGVF